MLEHEAKQAVETAGYRVESVTSIPEGYSHDNFIVTLWGGLPAIARFEKPGNQSSDGFRRCFYFNGLQSLRRERNLTELVREQGLPVPAVYGLHEDAQSPFLLVEQSSGMHWNKYLERQGYSLGAYLRSLRFVGHDIARAHSVRFNSFGDVMGKDNVHPGNTTNFLERVQVVTEFQLQRAQGAGLSKKDFGKMSKHFQTELTELKTLGDFNQQPVLILTDLHPTNFFVDSEGKPSSYFDLEFCQAGLPALELYAIRWNLLNYFDGVRQQAEEAFLAGYRDGGGTYNPDDSINKKLEHVFTLGHLLSVIVAYRNAADGLHDKWSKRFKQIMFDAADKGEVNYQAINEVLRSEINRPQFPS